MLEEIVPTLIRRVIDHFGRPSTHCDVTVFHEHKAMPKINQIVRSTMCHARRRAASIVQCVATALICSASSPTRHLRWTPFIGHEVKLGSLYEAGLMMGKRKRYSAEFKAKVAMDALRDELIVSQLAAKHEVHQTLVGDWKRQAMEGLATVFAGGREAKAGIREEEVEKLHAKIGQLVVERDLLAKAFVR